MATKDEWPEVWDTDPRQEGSRWIHRKPTPEELATWFNNNAGIDGELEAKDYVSGVTLISGVETEPGYDGTQRVTVKKLVHTPYPRVDTRIRYFWDLMLAHGWEGKIRPVTVPRPEVALPPGFGTLSIALPDRPGSVVRFLTCTQRVTYGEYDTHRLLVDAPPATKQIPAVNRGGYADEHLLMKCETGAVGRALGMAGILVLPGAGVATAEDMMEMQGGGGPSAAVPELPAEAAATQDIETLISEGLEKLDTEFPNEMEALRAWASEKDLDLSGGGKNLAPAQRRPVLRKLEQHLAAAAAAVTP